MIVWEVGVNLVYLANNIELRILYIHKCILCTLHVVFYFNGMDLLHFLKQIKYIDIIYMYVLKRL